jgi:hypothetical protein
MQTKARLDRAQREVLNSFGKVACVQQKKKKKKTSCVLIYQQGRGTSNRNPEISGSILDTKTIYIFMKLSR